MLFFTFFDLDSSTLSQHTDGFKQGATKKYEIINNKGDRCFRKFRIVLMKIIRQCEKKSRGSRTVSAENLVYAFVKNLRDEAI